MKNLSLFLLSLVVLASCSRSETKHCAAFDSTFIYDWLPYGGEGVTFYFTNGAGGHDTITSTDVVKGQAYDVSYIDYYPWGGGDARRCEVNGYVRMKASGKPDSVRMTGYHDTAAPRYYVYPQGAFFKHTVYDVVYNQLQFEFYNFPVTLQVQDNDIVNVVNNRRVVASLEKHPEYDFHGRKYYNVLVIAATQAPESSLRAKVDKLYIAKGYGVIGYRKIADSSEYWVTNP